MQKQMQGKQDGVMHTSVSELALAGSSPARLSRSTVQAMSATSSKSLSESMS